MKIGFIGAGNMGGAMIRSLFKSGGYLPSDVFVFDLDKSKVEALSDTGVTTREYAAEVVVQSDIVILAVKPNGVQSVLEELKDSFNNKKILVSIAVGIPIKFYKGILGDSQKVVRTMPNTPALVGQGMTLICKDDEVTKKEIEVVKGLFQCMGLVEELEEKLMSEVTAVTGSSPAYVYMFIEAMADAAVQSGIPRALAYKLAAQAVLGSAKMVLETGTHPGELKDQVCSPGGTTIQAVYTLEKMGFRASVMEAMCECTRKAKEIEKLFG